jgi:hypothetical protein
VVLTYITDINAISKRWLSGPTDVYSNGKFFADVKTSSNRSILVSFVYILKTEILSSFKSRLVPFIIPLVNRMLKPSIIWGHWRN